MRILFLLITSVVFAQQGPNVDFIKLNATIYPNFNKKSVQGNLVYEFKVFSKVDTIKIDAINMHFEKVLINGKKVKFRVSTKNLLLFEGFKKGKNKLTLTYIATPKQTMYFNTFDNDMQIWTQGQGKYTSHWLPSFDDVNEKIVFNTTVVFNKDYTVISNGINSVIKEKDSLKYWTYSMKKPMSSYLVMIAIGNYVKKSETTKTGTKLEYYLSKNDSNKFESTYKYTSKIFNFLELETGIKYPWQIYRQVPVKDFLYSGMENTTSTVFSQDFVVDKIAFNDKTYINVNAHELAHQWFGNLVTAKSSNHHWLQEGFATYYALLAEKEIFGEDYFNWELYQMAERLIQASKTDTIPLLNEKASSLTFYQKGAWALHYLRKNIGHNNFNKAVNSYLKKHSFLNVNTNDFLLEINKVSDFDTNKFSRNWLEKASFETTEALNILKKNNFINQYFEIISLQEIPFQNKKDRLLRVLESDLFYPIKQEVVFQLSDVAFIDKEVLLRKALLTNNIQVRQEIARSTTEIPLAFKADFETLLDDESYLTKEIALSSLWKLFPENQSEYLDKSSQWVGFNDKNLRIIWLTLALITSNYKVDQKQFYYDELLNYSTSNFESIVRQNALKNLLYINSKDTNALKNLVNATVHYKWQFVKYARDTIRSLIQNKVYKDYFIELMPNLPENEQLQLQRLLN